MTAAVLLDHVRAYATAVRSHLADLPPDLVDELTEGLEADLVAALEDGAGPVVTGEIPIGRAAAGAGVPPAQAESSSVIDLTRRFGSAAAYAAELRTAAGIAPAGPARPRTGWLRATFVARVVGVVHRWHDALRPFLATPQGQAVVSLVAVLRPLWWVLRGWVWSVLVASVFGEAGVGRFIPVSPIGWIWLAALVALSISIGRGWGAGHRVGRRVIVAASVLALLCTPWATTEMRRLVDYRLAAGQDGVETVVYESRYTDGVVVDGMEVSNLFVYDAQGNPLTGVQIFDDRGRPVRTTFDEGTQDWYLPGVDEPWRFAPVQDVDGRIRWNVYPLAGAPAPMWDDDGAGWGTAALRIPPRPFEKAPAVELPVGAEPASDEDTTDVGPEVPDGSSGEASSHP